LNRKNDMAKFQTAAPTDDDEALYPQDNAGADAPKKSKEDQGNVDDKAKEDKEDMAPTAVVDMKFLQGPGGEPVKEGDVCTVRVKKVYGNDVEIAYEKNPEKEPGAEGGPPGDEMSANDELDQINQE